ncbi:universal stress protein [Thalassiella azotivora]
MDVDGTVVVGYDGSSSSQEAVVWAAREAVRRARPLAVVYALDYARLAVAGAGAMAWFPGVLEDSAQDVAAEGVDVARKVEPSVDVRPVAHLGGATTALVEASRTAHLVVLATRGHGRVVGGLLGSVAFAVTSHARCPVVVVRGETEPVGPGRPVVVGVDGSPAAQAALEHAAQAAAAADAPLRVVAAWSAAPAHDWETTYWARAFPGQDPEDVVRRAALTHLAEARDAVTHGHPELDVTTDDVEGAPSEVLTRASEGAGLVVVGARGRGGAASLLLGSVSRGLVHAAHCPVQVVHVPARATTEVTTEATA